MTDLHITLAQARDADPSGTPCDCGALLDPSGLCFACESWTGTP